MSEKFLEPTYPLLGTIYLHPNRRDLIIHGPESAYSLDVDEARDLLEVLLDIVPDGYAIASNYVLEYEKRQYMESKR